MTDKPDQARLKRKRPSRNKSAIRIPISLHFYAVEIVVIVLIVFIFNIYIQSMVDKFISNECNSRIDNAFNSTQNLATILGESLDASDINSPESIRESLYNSIVTSADLSNQATITLYTITDKEPDKYLLIYPNAQNSQSYVNNADKVLSKVFEEGGYKKEFLNRTQTIELDGNKYYYRCMLTTYMKKTYEEQIVDNKTVIVEKTETVDLDDYYLCVFINSSPYYSFMAAETLALIQAALIAIIIAGILSMVMTYPLIFSTQKLSKFAKRISKGDFRPVRGHIVSKELSELGDIMNQMAFKLEESDVDQKTFFQNASHELRTPLMSIQGYAEGLKYGVFESDEDRNNAIDVIIDETGRLSSLVENLLSISKMDMSRSGNFEVKKQNIDATKICDTIIDKVRGNFIHEDKSIINDIHLTSTYIYANENDLIRCLENIFANCLRYCKTAVTFRCNCDETGSNVIFEISDDGPGIAPEVLDHLFERFSKGSDGKHGIGLALAKAIAEEHNGKITAENKPEGGACFKIFIPVTFNRVQLTKMNKDSTN